MKHNNMFSKAHGGQFGAGSQPFNITVDIPLIIGGAVAGVPMFTNLRIAIMDEGDAYVCDIYCVDGVFIAAPKKEWRHLRGARRDRFDIVCERISPYHENDRWTKMRDGMDDSKGGVKNASYMPLCVVYEASREQQEAMG